MEDESKPSAAASVINGDEDRSEKANPETMEVERAKAAAGDKRTKLHRTLPVSLWLQGLRWNATKNEERGPFCRKALLEFIEKRNHLEIKTSYLISLTSPHLPAKFL